jgi:hypothetical protein
LEHLRQAQRSKEELPKLQDMVKRYAKETKQDIELSMIDIDFL